MRTRLFEIVVILLVAGYSDCRPQQDGTRTSNGPEVGETSSEGWKQVRPTDTTDRYDGLRVDNSESNGTTQRHLKDLQYIDQSLRTVATQLLNTSSPEATVRIDTASTMKGSADGTKQNTNDAALIKEVNSEISNLESMGVGFGRPVNSKFGYFESSHPGHAMAMTEEELEREMTSTRLMTTYKNQPTTTGGISTWILLNPPSTTAKTVKDNNEKLMQPLQTEVKISTRPITTLNKMETSMDEKIMEKVSSSSMIPVQKTSPVTKKPTSPSRKPSTTTQKPEKTTENFEKIDTIHTTVVVDTTKSKEPASLTPLPSSTTKRIQIPKTTPKPKTTTIRSTSLKPSTTKRPNQQGKPKPSTTRRTTIKTTVKPDIIRQENATAKIEKVTFRPMQTITTTKIEKKPDTTDRPMFVTKIKASVLMDTQKVTTVPITTTTSLNLTTPKTNSSNSLGSGLVEVPVKSKISGTKVNNILKVQLKKPIDDSTTIEIEPIKVNAPVLKIEKVELETATKDPIEEIAEKVKDDLDHSRIDLKFDFNPELTKINVESSTESTSTTANTVSSTTKRTRQSNKRKKNKVRRRKPTSTTAVTASTTSTSVMATSSMFALETTETSTDPTLFDNAIQESKIAPESKIATNGTKTKKKQPQKAISTQIYNFLSREVMPSFGVMSLVGLGLGLASYFLYPFSGTITRRNYEVEPNYKYNLDEYGGNYGQNEEEVLSKVLQGMTKQDSKYSGVKDLDNNYYRYQHYDGAYDPYTTRRTDQRYSSVSSSPLYRPVENTASLKYRNTEYRYQDVAQTTPNYYERPKHTEYVVGQNVQATGHRQFVVGNVPKEYPVYEDKVPALTVGKKAVDNTYESTETDNGQLPHFNYASSSANVQNYAHTETQTLRTDDGYEEIEITPTAVAVEHGPRSFKVKRSVTDEQANDLVGNVEDVLRRRVSTDDSHDNDASKLTKQSFKEIKEGTIPKSLFHYVHSKVRTLTEEQLAEDERVRSRSKRDSVIQVIPSRRELEEENNEEDLSNEILDIIDSALPVHENSKDKTKHNEVEDFDSKKKKQTQLKELAMKTSTTSEKTREEEINTVSSTGPSNVASDITSKVKKDVTEIHEIEDVASFSTLAPSPFSSSASSSSPMIVDDDSMKEHEETTVKDEDTSTEKPKEPEENFNIFNFVKKVAEIKFRLGLTILKHASEGFARYLGHVQKRLNGEE